MISGLTAVTYALLLPTIGLSTITAVKFCNVAEVFVPLVQVSANELFIYGPGLAAPQSA